MSTRLIRNATAVHDDRQGRPAALASGRRDFIKMLAGGAGVTAAATLAGCDAVFNLPDEPVTTPTAVLGSGDTGILNYAYALEQLEAEFYTQVADNWYGENNAEFDRLRDIRDHEMVHRDFLKAALGTSAIMDLEFDFSSVDYGDRLSVLNAARVFEDLGIAAYNGAAVLISDLNLLAVAGKIVSVEARHAGLIRDLIFSFTEYFAGAPDIVNENGSDWKLSPAEVLERASGFILTPIDASGLVS